MSRSPKPNMYWEPRQNPNFDCSLGVLSWDVIPLQQSQALRVEILSTSLGECRGAANLTVFAGRGEVRSGSAAGRQLELWEPARSFGDPAHESLFARILELDSCATGSVFDCEIDAPEGLLTVRRTIWHPPHGGNPATRWTDGDFAGMLFEPAGDSRIYRCNAGRRADDFNQLVFSVTLLD